MSTTVSISDDAEPPEYRDEVLPPWVSESVAIEQAQAVIGIATERLAAANAG